MDISSTFLFTSEVGLKHFKLIDRLILDPELHIVKRYPIFFSE